MGVYVHIPFCRSKCYYCGFYSVASIVFKQAFIRALCREIELRKDYLGTYKPETLYLGGGTPSYLTLDELQIILQKLEEIHPLSLSAERTIEMNPEDLVPAKLNELRRLGFNRLSIGIQTFNEKGLKKMNRTHTARQAIDGIFCAAESGFENIGIDFIIGMPGNTLENIKADLKQIQYLPVSHVSVYILSIEEGSVFARQIEKGIFAPPPEERVAEEYFFVADALREMGFEHYEISNFARAGKYSVHNSNYWSKKPYIGLGPSAHSFNLHSRQWNIANVKTYSESLDKDILKFDFEELTEVDQYNEYIMTGLRTMWGINLDILRSTYKKYWSSVESRIAAYIQQGWAKRDGNHLVLTERGWLVSDYIFCDLFVIS